MLKLKQIDFFKLPSLPRISSTTVNNTKHRRRGRWRSSDILPQLKENLRAAMLNAIRFRDHHIYLLTNVLFWLDFKVLFQWKSFI